MERHGLQSESSDDPITRRIIAAAIQVHRALGPGLLESAYQACLAHECSNRGLVCALELALPVRYNGLLMDCGYRIDMLIEDEVIVEIKCVETVLPIHLAQLMTYLRLSGKNRGLLINFNVPVLKDGLYRRVLDWRQDSSSAPSASLR